MSYLSFAQISDSEVEYLETYIYQTTSSAFKVKEYDSKIDNEYTLPWLKKNIDKLILDSALDTLIKKATIKIDKNSFSDYFLEFNSYFPESIKEAPENFQLNIKENKIASQNEILEFNGGGSSAYSNYIYSTSENGQYSDHNWVSFYKSFSIKSEVTSEEFNGKITFEASFLYNYDYVKISKSHIGKQLKVGSYLFKVIDIINNLLVLEFEKNIDDEEFSFVNLNSENRMIKSSIPTFSKLKISKEVYKLFKENPNLSFDDFKKVMHPQFLERRKYSNNAKVLSDLIFEKSYIIFSFPGNTLNSYLYLSNRNFKTFEIEYDKYSIIQKPYTY
jgi:hypothetical protein